MKKILYWVLSAHTFVQLGNRKVFGISNLFAIMCICTFIAAVPIAMEYSYADSFPYVIPFLFFGLLFVTNKFTLGNVSKEIRDTFWRTQLARFKDSKFHYIKVAYPNWERRERDLETMWLREYGVTFENTKAPWFQKVRVLLLPIMGGLGILLGILLK